MMSKLVQLIEGLKVIQGLGDSGVAADHEVIYAGSVSEMTPEQRQLMLDLGWLPDEKTDCWQLLV